MTEVSIGPTTDLNVLWDKDASRVADVLISHGRLEILLHSTDHEWVRQACNTVAAQYPTIVIACPDR